MQSNVFRATVLIVATVWLVITINTSSPPRHRSLSRPTKATPACDACEFKLASIVFSKGGSGVTEMAGVVADLYKLRWRELGMLLCRQPVLIAKNRYDQTITIYTFEKGVLVHETDTGPYILDWSIVDNWCQSKGITVVKKAGPTPVGPIFNPKLPFYDALCRPRSSGC